MQRIAQSQTARIGNIHSLEGRVDPLNVVSAGAERAAVHVSVPAGQLNTTRVLPDTERVSARSLKTMTSALAGAVATSNTNAIMTFTGSGYTGWNRHRLTSRLRQYISPKPHSLTLQLSPPRSGTAPPPRRPLQAAEHPATRATNPLRRRRTSRRAGVAA